MAILPARSLWLPLLGAVGRAQGVWAVCVWVRPLRRRFALHVCPIPV